MENDSTSLEKLKTIINQRKEYLAENVKKDSDYAKIAIASARKQLDIAQEDQAAWDEQVIYAAHCETGNIVDRMTKITAQIWSLNWVLRVMETLEKEKQETNDEQKEDN